MRAAEAVDWLVPTAYSGAWAQTMWIQYHASRLRCFAWTIDRDPKDC